MSTLEMMRCGEIPVIPNGNVSAEQKPYNKDEHVQIQCNEGFEAQVFSFRCQEGEWSSGGLALDEICTRTSSVDRRHDCPLLFVNSGCVFVLLQPTTVAVLPHLNLTTQL